MINFKETTLNIGEIEPNDVAFVNFDYTGDQSNIVYVRPHCGCTGDHIFLSSGSKNTLQFKFTESDTKELTQHHIDTYYSGNIYEFTKHITIYLKDNEPLYVYNDNGEKDYNSSKAHIDLYFTGAVDISNLEPKQIITP